MNDKAQARIHIILIWLWVVQMVVLPFVVIYLPHIWSKISFLYLIEISLYSCLSGDVDALASNEASMKIVTSRQVREVTTESVML